MQYQFKYIKGNTKATYQFEYLIKQRPVYYGFRYSKGLCHGAYKFQYGIDKGNMHLEEGFKNYAYMGREIVSDKLVQYFSFIERKLEEEKQILLNLDDKEINLNQEDLSLNKKMDLALQEEISLDKNRFNIEISSFMELKPEEKDIISDSVYLLIGNTKGMILASTFLFESKNKIVIFPILKTQQRESKQLTAQVLNQFNVPIKQSSIQQSWLIDHIMQETIVESLKGFDEKEKELILKRSSIIAANNIRHMHVAKTYLMNRLNQEIFLLLLKLFQAEHDLKTENSIYLQTKINQLDKENELKLDMWPSELNFEKLMPIELNSVRDIQAENSWFLQNISPDMTVERRVANLEISVHELEFLNELINLSTMVEIKCNNEILKLWRFQEREVELESEVFFVKWFVDLFKESNDQSLQKTYKDSQVINSVQRLVQYASQLITFSYVFNLEANRLQINLLIDSNRIELNKISKKLYLSNSDRNYYLEDYEKDLALNDKSLLMSIECVKETILDNFSLILSLQRKTECFKEEVLQDISRLVDSQLIQENGVYAGERFAPKTLASEKRQALFLRNFEGELDIEKVNHYLNRLEAKLLEKEHGSLEITRENILEINELINYYLLKRSCEKQILLTNIERPLIKNVWLDICIEEEMKKLINKEIQKELSICGKQQLYARLDNELYEHKMQDRFIRVLYKDMESVSIFTSMLEKVLKDITYTLPIVALKKAKDIRTVDEVIFTKKWLRDIENDEVHKNLNKIQNRKLHISDLQHFTRNLLKDIKSIFNQQLVDLIKTICLKTEDNIQLIDRVINNKTLLEENSLFQGERFSFKEISNTPFIDGFIKEILRKIGIDSYEEYLNKGFKENALNIAELATTRETDKPIVIVDEPIETDKKFLIDILQDEHLLNLYKRFWVVGNSDFKDLIVLPDHDFNYEEEPIEGEINSLIPENYHVVYPNQFAHIIDKHPIPFGKELAPDEIDVSINIMIDLINIFIMMWCKFTPAFWGWTGTQAVIGITQSIYEFITLDTSRSIQKSKKVKEQYDRAYKWLRWEAEKAALLARNDMSLRGNYYVGILLEELIYYMVDHHFDVMPLFRDANKMDEWRTLFDRAVEKDIKFVLDKVKGIRHKIMEGK